MLSTVARNTGTKFTTFAVQQAAGKADHRSLHWQQKKQEPCEGCFFYLVRRGCPGSAGPIGCGPRCFPVRTGMKEVKVCLPKQWAY